jgi:signal transduction histidine kinase/DNA-binding response OmpR family regulator
MAKILIVDDNAANRDMLHSLLGYAGHSVLEAADGLEGLEKAQSDPPELIIADIVMPTMDGFEFVRRLRGDPVIGSTKVIFYTPAYYESEARKLAGDCGVVHILTKPSEPQDILDTINLALGITSPPLTARSFDEFDRDQLQLLTDQLSKKSTELEASGLRLAALIEIGQDLAGEPNAELMLENVCRAARKIVGAKYAAVGILNEGKNTLCQFFASGMNDEDARRISDLPPTKGVLGDLLTGRRAIRLRNLDRDLEVSEVQGAGSFLGTPILTRSRVYGWLFLTHKLTADQFNDKDERLAATLAAQAAVAYENAIRYIEIQQQAAVLEQRVKERTVELNRSNADLEQFAYVASHDLQEPLRMVSSYCQLLEQRYKGKLDEKADKYITYAVDGATRLRRLINDLLEYSRVGTRIKELKPVDSQRAFAQAFANLHKLIEETNAVVMSDPLPTVIGDELQLVSLFQNLIGNAIKFQGEESPRVYVSAERKGDDHVFTVQDNGVGIDPQFFDRIFVIFQRLQTTTKYPSTGIGLAICKKIVERHGGRIWVESEPGKGSAFYFTFPHHQEPDSLGQEHRYELCKTNPAH